MINWRPDVTCSLGDTWLDLAVKISTRATLCACDQYVAAVALDRFAISTSAGCFRDLV